MVASRVVASAGGEDPIAARLAELQRQIEELSRRTLNQATIDSGGLSIINGGELTVLHPSGDWLLKVAKGVQGKYYLSIHRDDGTVALEIGTTTGGKQYWALYDRSGNIVASDDALSANGLARPWLMMPTVNVVSTAIPTVPSSTYIAVQSTGMILKQQPYADVQALVLSTGGAVGEARFTVNGVAAGDVMPITAGLYQWQPIQTLALPGSYNNYVRVELEVQVTNATGSIGGVLVATQRQSP